MTKDCYLEELRLLSIHVHGAQFSDLVYLFILQHLVVTLYSFP